MWLSLDDRNALLNRLSFEGVTAIAISVAVWVYVYRHRLREGATRAILVGLVFAILFLPIVFFKTAVAVFPRFGPD